MEGVGEAQYIDDVMVVVNKYEVRAFVMEDYGAKETDTIYEADIQSTLMR